MPTRNRFISILTISQHWAVSKPGSGDEDVRPYEDPGHGGHLEVGV